MLLERASAPGPRPGELGWTTAVPQNPLQHLPENLEKKEQGLRSRLHTVSSWEEPICEYLKPSQSHVRDFPGGAVVKYPPANEGDTGSSPGPGRSHMPRSN